MEIPPSLPPDKQSWFSWFKKERSETSFKKERSETSNSKLESTITSVSTNRFRSNPISRLYQKIARTISRWKESRLNANTIAKVEKTREDSLSNFLNNKEIPDNNLFYLETTNFRIANRNPNLFGITEEQLKAALEKVKLNGMELNNLSEEERADPEVVQAAVKQNPLAFQFALGEGRNICLQTLRENPSLIFGLTTIKRFGERQSRIHPIPAEIQTEFAILLLTQNRAQVEENLGIIQKLNKEIHRLIAAKRPELLHYLKEEVQREFIVRTPENIRYAEENVQKEFAEGTPKVYLRFANEKIQKEIIEKNFQNIEFAKDTIIKEYPPLVLYAEEETQRKLAKEQPTVYLQYTKPSIQLEIVTNFPDILFQEDQISLANLDETVQYNFLFNHPELMTKYPGLLSKVSGKVQKLLINEKPEAYLRYADPDIQRAEINHKPTLFPHVEEEFQEEVTIHQPALLAYASDNIQERLVNEKPEIYFKNAKKSIQDKLVEKNLDLFKFLDPTVQREMLGKTPEKFLKYADQNIQLEFLNTKGPALLKFASEEAQLSYLNMNPGYYKLSSIELQINKPGIIERGNVFLEVFQDGMKLKNCKEYRKDPIIAAAAVRQNLNAFQYVQGFIAEQHVALDIHRSRKPYKDPALFAQLPPFLKELLIYTFPKQYPPEHNF